MLLRLSLRFAGVRRPLLSLASVALVAGLTSLPFYNALLMADALTGFAILAFLLLAVDRGRLSRNERVFLVAVMLVSAVSHLTHIVILLAMTLALAGAVAVRRLSWRAHRLALGSGAAVVALGLVSVGVSALVIEKAFKRPPQLVPLLTSRFIEDGPGAAFIREGCDGGRFVICHLPNAVGARAIDILWSTDRRLGTFMLVDTPTRERLSAEDTRFALAVFEAHPAGVIAAMVRNTAAQLADFHNDGLVQDCFDQPTCWNSLPPGERAKLRASVAGRNMWPVRFLDWLHYTVVFAALALLAGALLTRAQTPAQRDLRLWVLLTGVAMVTNAFLCGAVSIPQYRYQGRIIWLLPLLAWLMVLSMTQAQRWIGLPRRSGEQLPSSP